jgi:hypothetical protein
MSQLKHGRYWGIGILAACTLLGANTAALGQVSVGVGVAVPGFRLGIDIPAYPDLVPIPGYPVYYAPRLGVNLFFYDGQYWLFAEDNWYYSSWYDGPWYLAQPAFVPDFILRIPIFYYRRPPPYFLRWNRQGPPHWGERWGRAWEQRRPGWDRWNRAAVPPRAPLPSYQRRYPRGRYPAPGEQRNLENRYYPFRPGNPRSPSPAQRPSRQGRRFAPQPYRPFPEGRPERPAPGRIAPREMQRPGAGGPPPARGRGPEANGRPRRGAAPQGNHSRSAGRPQRQEQGRRRSGPPAG